MQRMNITPQLRAYVLHVVDTALLPPQDLFPSSESAIDRAKSSDEGRQAVRQLEHHANAYEINDLELIVEVFTGRLKVRKLKLAKERAKSDAKRSARLAKQQLKADAKQDGKRRERIAKRRAERDAAKKAASEVTQEAA